MADTIWQFLIWIYYLLQKKLIFYSQIKFEAISNGDT